MSTLEMIHAAYGRIQADVRRTPLLSSPFLDDIAGRTLLVKAECLQHTGSFKFRGAMSALSGLDDAARQKGVIAFSSGNHAQGIALAARRHAVKAVIVMPSDAPALKIANTRALGAEIVLYDRATEDRDEIGERLAQERGLTLVRPFDEPLVIAGQGSVGLEIAAQSQGPAEVLVPCGGGGLTSGTALALEGTGMQVRPCEPEGFDDVARSLKAGERLSNPSTTGSVCDAIITPVAGKITFPIMARLCGAGLVVSDDECLMAVALAFKRLKIVLEPGGAAALAAALFHGDKVNAETVIAVASGGNVDADVFSSAIARFGDL